MDDSKYRPHLADSFLCKAKVSLFICFVLVCTSIPEQQYEFCSAHKFDQGVDVVFKNNFYLTVI